MPDWNTIKAEYLRGDTSYRKLVDKYGVSFSALRRRAKAEKWTDLRAQTAHRVSTRITDAVVRKEAEKADKIQTVADLLLAKIAEGVAEGSLVESSQSIRHIVSSLKDLKEIKGFKSELDLQEQMARIDKLRKEAEGDQEDREIHVTLSGGAEEYAV